MLGSIGQLARAARARPRPDAALAGWRAVGDTLVGVMVMVMAEEISARAGEFQQRGV